MSLPVRRLTHTAPRTLARIPISRIPSTFSSSSITRAVRTTAPKFSTMAARQSAAPAAPADKSYDPEIQDMAKYIHQYNVDSDLAVSLFVSFHKRLELDLRLMHSGNRNRWILPALFSWTL